MLLHDTGTGSYSVLAPDLMGAIEYTTDGPVWTPGFIPLSTGATVTAFNSGSTPNERALKFALPFKARVRGVLITLANIAAGADYQVSIWDTSGTTDAGVLASFDMDGDSTIGTTNDGPMLLTFQTSVVLNPGTYYLGIRPETVNSISIPVIPVIALSNAMQAMPWGADCYVSTRTWSAGTGGAWSDTTTQVPLLSLLIDGLDDGAGGGRANYILGV
jgi:hypothetical protein